MSASPAATVEIAPLRRRDLRQVLPIERAAYPVSWTRPVFLAELDQVRDGTRYYVAAREGREVVGYAGLWIVPDPDGDQAHVTNIVVAAERRRTGIGRRLMVDLARHARSLGCRAWTLEVRASNTAAIELYRRFGFAPAGVRRKYYENTEDALVMWCHDLPTERYGELLDDLEAAT